MFLKVHKISLKASFVATISTQHYYFDFHLFGLVGASLRWLVLGLAITLVDPFYYDNAEWLRIHIKKYICT